MTDVLVVGGGVMGTLSAWELAKRGLAVTVLERSIPGAEASTAAAGMLGAQLEAHEGEAEANADGFAARALWDGFVRALEDETGVPVGYEPCGALVVGKKAEGYRWQAAAGLRAETLTPDETAKLEPALARTESLWLPGDGQVDPPKMFRALQVACARRGVVFRTGEDVARVVVDGGRATGVLLGSGTVLSAAHVVLAAGSWSSLVQGTPLARDAVKPVRGQMVEVSLRSPAFSRVVAGDGVYLVPRRDGRVTIGSTMEHVGFEKRVTAGAVAELLSRAIAVVPVLADATLGATWSSFRPFAPKALVGASEVPGLVYATGHHRNGILLAPLTAARVAKAVFG